MAITIPIESPHWLLKTPVELLGLLRKRDIPSLSSDGKTIHYSDLSLHVHVLKGKDLRLLPDQEPCLRIPILPSEDTAILTERLCDIVLATLHDQHLPGLQFPQLFLNNLYDLNGAAPGTISGNYEIKELQALVLVSVKDGYGSGRAEDMGDHLENGVHDCITDCLKSIREIDISRPSRLQDPFDNAIKLTFDAHRLQSPSSRRHGWVGFCETADMPILVFLVTDAQHRAALEMAGINRMAELHAFRDTVDRGFGQGMKEYKSIGYVTEDLMEAADLAPLTEGVLSVGMDGRGRVRMDFVDWDGGLPWSGGGEDGGDENGGDEDDDDEKGAGEKSPSEKGAGDNCMSEKDAGQKDSGEKV